MSKYLTSILAGSALAALGALQPATAAPYSNYRATVAAAPAAPAATATSFEVILPLRNLAAAQQLAADQQNPASANYQKWLTPAQFAAQYGPTAASIANVKAALVAAGLQVDAVNARSITVSGTAAQVNQAFQINLKLVQSGAKSSLAATAVPTMPAALSKEGASINSFAPIQPRHSFATRTPAAVPENRYGAVGPYWFTDLKEAYDYPAYQSTLPSGQRLDGTGVRAAVLMEDQIFPGDVAAFFNHEKFTAVSGTPAPTVNTVLVDGGGVVGGDGTFEASLDVQQITGGAPGSNVTLVSIPNLSDQHIYDGYNYIVMHPELYDIVNSSFGGCELEYTPAFNNGVDYTYILSNLDQLFLQGTLEGITFVASSGDQGGLLCPSANYGLSAGPYTFTKGVSSPADSTYVTAVGGGNLQTVANGSLDSTYAAENGFGDPDIPYDIFGIGETVSGGYWGAGGGRSSIFPRPSYQSAALTLGGNFRTLPDVGMQVGGCPLGIAYTPCGPDRSAAVVAYGINYGGAYYGVIGTSVSSPEFVGAIALYIQKTGHKVGNINPYLYSKGAAQTAAGGPNAPAASHFFHRGIQGFDGAWPSGFPSANYDYIFGNGSPDVRALFGFSGFSSAGTPQTPSNP
jgi:subtilase family serine protease